jgi:hypothetical protein
MSKGKNLSWNDRLTIINHFNPSDAEAISAFDISQNELDVARTQLKTGVFNIDPSLDVESYGHMFAISTENGSTVTSTTSPARKTGSTTISKRETASAKSGEPKKRGRKGDKILKAFTSIPDTPVVAEEFAKEHGVSIAVLRQSKRFDLSKTVGTVRVKKDKGTKTLMIWREEQI